MVTVGAIGGVLHLSPESPAIVGEGEAAAGGKRAAGGMGIFFLSEPAREGDTALQAGGLRLIEDRTVATSAASSSWGARARQVTGALGQEALAGVVLLLLGGVIILLLMKVRRRGPWSPRMPR